MNNFENIKQMNIDQLARFLQSASDEICFATCLKKSGNKFECPISRDITTEDCVRCMKTWLEKDI